MEAQMPLRKRKKAQTRESLIAAAMELFDKNGFESTTVDEIAALAEVSRRTFFRYFATKDLVLFPHQEIYVGLFRDMLGHPAPGEEPFDTLRRASLEMARHYTRERETHLRQQRIIQGSSYLIGRGDQFDDDWEAAIKETLLGAAPKSKGAVDRRAAYLAAATMGLIRAVLREWYESDCRKDLVHLGEEAFSLIEASVRDHWALANGKGARRPM